MLHSELLVMQVHRFLPRKVESRFDGLQKLEYLCGIENVSLRSTSLAIATYSKR